MELDFQKMDGLVPAIIQDADTKVVLMLGFMNEEAFKEFMSQVHERELYDTGVDAEYGDQLLTLSTCEYTYTNGRLVVIAKKVN